MASGSDVGYDDAISEVYGFAGIAAMERAWHDSLEAPGSVAAAGSGMPRP